MDLYGYPMLLTFIRNQEVTTLFISSTVVGTSFEVTVEKVTSPYSNQPISIILETISAPLCSRGPSSNVDEKADSNPIESICAPFGIPNPSNTSGVNGSEMKTDRSLEEFMAYIIDQPVVISKLNGFEPLFNTTPRLELLSTDGKIPFYVSFEDLSVELGYIAVRVRIVDFSYLRKVVTERQILKNTILYMLSNDFPKDFINFSYENKKVRVDI